MKTALLLIALGERYRRFLWDVLLPSAKQFFVPHTPIVWCDTFKEMNFNAIGIHQDDLGFPAATFRRYHFFSEQAHILAEFDQVFYCDVDMRFVAPVSGEDIFSDGITATLHPGFVAGYIDASGYLVSTAGTPERNPKSTAMIPIGTNNRYFCGGFNGGSTQEFLKMTNKIRENIDIDTQNGVFARWHDEAHLNRYLYDNPPSRILTPSFCYPENYPGQWGWPPNQYPPLLVALDKGNKI